MAETPFFFPVAGQSLFGVFHDPHERRGDVTYVFCHPFAEEKLWTHRVLVAFARRLAAAGHPVLRFDYFGNGDSGGTFSASSLATACAGVHGAIDEARRRSGASSVGLLGLRLGAAIASLVAEESSHVERLILWAPIVDGARYMQEMLRINLASQLAVHKEVRQDRKQLVEAMRAGETVNVDGYDLAFPLYSEVTALSLAGAAKRFAGECLIVQVDRAGRAVDPELQRLAASYSRSTLAVAVEEPFWKEIVQFYQEAPDLFNRTLAWLNDPTDA